MKLFLSLLLFLGILFAVLTFLAPKEFIIERTIVVQKPIGQVFERLKYLKNHEEWNAWSRKDPTTKKEFVGTDGTIGFKSSWSSENDELGTAEQEITGITEGKRMDTVIRFKKPFEGIFDSYIITESISEKETSVKLGMHDNMSFPMTVISFIVNDCLGNRKKIEANMDESLRNLKGVLEGTS
jgi:hypothetical protein